MKDDFALRWRQLWRDLGLEPPAEALDEILSAYGDPSRHYHSIDHLHDSLQLFDEVRMLAQDPAVVELAVWYHDAVYHTAGTDNESQSAGRARRAVLAAGGAEEVARRVGELILATEHRQSAVDDDAALLCDIDLAILGSSRERFDQYERQIRAEYEWVPETQYREGRRAILQRLLDRPRIYATESFFQRFEGLARSNLQRSLERLAKGGAQ